MSDVIDRPHARTGSDRQEPAAHHRLRHPSEPAFAQPISIRSCQNAGRSI